MAKRIKNTKRRTAPPKPKTNDGTQLEMVVLTPDEYETMRYEMFTDVWNMCITQMMAFPILMVEDHLYDIWVNKDKPDSRAERVRSFMNSYMTCFVSGNRSMDDFCKEVYGKTGINLRKQPSKDDVESNK